MPDSEFPKLIYPIPEELEAQFKTKLPKVRQGQMRVKAWPWRDLQGRLLKVTQRFPHPTKEKDFVPYTLWEVAPGRHEWKPMDHPKLRPLYGLDRLAGDINAPVIVVEGEKTADAVSNVFPGYVGTTSGSATSAGKADWEPLKGGEVIIWPDHDEPGRKYALEVASRMKDLAESIRIVQVPDSFPEGWDLADPLPPGVTIEDLRRLLDEAEEVGQRSAKDSGQSGTAPESTPLNLEPKRALRTLTAGEIFKLPPRSKEWLWEPFIPLGREGMVAALGDVGKTAFHLQLAVAVATGRNLFGFPTRPAPSGVLFITYEDDPAEDFRERLAWVKETYADWDKSDDSALNQRLVLADPTWDKDCSIRSIQGEIEAELEGMKAQGIPPALLIFETLASVTEGDGNSDESTRNVWNVARAIKKRHGVTVSIAHHHRKPSNEETKDALSQLDPRKARGTGNNSDAARWTIQLAAIPHEKAEGLGLDPARAMKGAYALIGATKVKAERPDPLVLERLPAGTPGCHCWERRLDGDRIFATLLASKKVKAELDNQERVGLAVLELGDRATREEVAALVGIETRAVETAVSALRKKQRLGSKRSPYALTPDGMSWVQALKHNTGAAQVDELDEMLVPMRDSGGLGQSEHRSNTGPFEQGSGNSRTHNALGGDACVSYAPVGSEAPHRIVV